MSAAPPFLVVIPARYSSTRLPGKPLRELAGKPMIAHVVDRGFESGAGRVFVAADDERIVAAAQEAGAEAVMTSPDHASGTDRIAEVAARHGWSDDAIAVNLQGDEPCLDGELVRQVAVALQAHPDAGIATLATPIATAQELFDPNCVKVVVDERGFARYFSRAPIPWVRGAFDGGAAALGPLPDGVPFLRHLGLYAYRVGVLRRLCAAPQAACERAESLEQLRALAIGVEIHVSVVSDAPGHGVDTEADLERAARELTRRLEQ